jgi:pyruvate dehydrogenase E1 component beta subunit
MVTKQTHLMTNYGIAIRDGFVHLLKSHPETFTIGQGLWSPWYVGNTMTDLDIEFGRERVIDTPVSENGCTGIALGSALSGKRPIVIHPRMDFAILAVDQIVNQAAKWRHMFGGQVSAPVTVRAIINRGGEQGAQHSQALHSWFAHVPGLRVVMPSTVADARDLLIASVLGNDPVMYVDDRWLYELEEELDPVSTIKLSSVSPKLTSSGDDITLVGAGFSSHLCRGADKALREKGITSDVYDLRVINPLDCGLIAQSVERTGRLLVVDGGWSNCGLAAEVIAQVSMLVDLQKWQSRPSRITIVDAPAPTSKPLEDIYYPTVETVIARVRELLA